MSDLAKEFQESKLGLSGPVVVAEARRVATPYQPELEYLVALAAIEAKASAQAAATGLTIGLICEQEAPAAIGVYDPAGRFAWMRTGRTAEPVEIPPDQVLIVNGSYSAEAWTERGVTPLLPPAASVAGFIDGDMFPPDTQYVYDLFSAPLTPGQYLLMGGSPEEVGLFVSFIEQSGLVVSVKTMPGTVLLSRTFWLENAVALLAVAAGFVCCCLIMSVLVAGQRSRLSVHVLVGAARTQLAARMVAATVPATVLGGAIGAATGLVGTRWTGADMAARFLASWAGAAGLISAAFFGLVAISVGLIEKRRRR